MASTTITTGASTALASLPSLVGLFAGHALAGLNTTIQGEIATVESDVNSKLDEMRAALDKAETDNPLVGSAISAAVGTLVALGLEVPSEDVVFTHVKQAADALLEAFKAA
jgi:hypothetical protein